MTIYIVHTVPVLPGEHKRFFCRRESELLLLSICLSSSSFFVVVVVVLDIYYISESGVDIYRSLFRGLHRHQWRIVGIVYLQQQNLCL